MTNKQRDFEGQKQPGLDYQRHSSISKPELPSCASTNLNLNGDGECYAKCLSLCSNVRASNCIWEVMFRKSAAAHNYPKNHTKNNPHPTTNHNNTQQNQTKTHKPTTPQNNKKTHPDTKW
ncbi:hypothetical protein J6590_039398 [Homalodisca vitripennis]|nr:hypothetical protein J6590_039398 [Homalodisca vitripennis]